MVIRFVNACCSKGAVIDLEVEVRWGFILEERGGGGEVAALFLEQGSPKLVASNPIISALVGRIGTH